MTARYHIIVREELTGSKPGREGRATVGLKKVEDDPMRAGTFWTAADYKVLARAAKLLLNQERK
jgi:hypothetical protein